MITVEKAKNLIEHFAEKQQGGHFACPRCGRTAMNAESVTRNALSRRIDVYVCDSCGMQEALEDTLYAQCNTNGTDENALVLCSTRPQGISLRTNRGECLRL